VKQPPASTALLGGMGPIAARGLQRLSPAPAQPRPGQRPAQAGLHSSELALPVAMGILHRRTAIGWRAWGPALAARSPCTMALQKTVTTTATVSSSSSSSSSGGGGGMTQKRTLAEDLLGPSRKPRHPDAHLYDRIDHRVLRLGMGEGAPAKKVALFHLGPTAAAAQGGEEAAPTAVAQAQQGNLSPGEGADDELWSV
jgi:hypothetical protein